VYPILFERCGRCHVTGGIAPMSLLGYAEAVPWGASIRNELLAGHMPPGVVDEAPSRFRDRSGLTSRELNVLLTWVTGGTPVGGPDRGPAPVTPNQQPPALLPRGPADAAAWPLGQPDLTFALPADGVLAAGEREKTVEFVLATGTSESRWLRAVDLLPGNRTMVRAATIAVRAPAVAGTTTAVERTLALWLPGMDASALEPGVGFELPPSAELIVRLLYRKTWEFENRELRDRSTIGLYFARAPAVTLQAVRLDAPGVTRAMSGRLAFSQVLNDDVRALAIYPATGVNDVGVRVVAIRPDRTRVDLIAFHPRRDWVRRYWFREPIVLPRGTTIEVTATEDELTLLPVSPAPASAMPADLSSLGLTLNVVTCDAC
jgi:hypothetical protein